jgi:hypothetical protein
MLFTETERGEAMGYFKPSRYQIENALREAARYDGIFVGDNYVTKDHGDYIEINIDADNSNGHVSYDLYFDDDGKLIRWEKHR